MNYYNLKVQIQDPEGVLRETETYWNFKDDKDALMFLYGYAEGFAKAFNAVITKRELDKEETTKHEQVI
jgi:hypothetical protein